MILSVVACGANDKETQTYSTVAETTQDIDAIVEKKVQEQPEIERRVQESVAAAKAESSVAETTVPVSIVARTYILPFSSERLVTNDDMVALSKNQLRLARNEMYARCETIFQSADLNSYFTSQS